MVIFVIFVIYISFQVGGSIPYYHANSQNNIIHSDCFRISDNMAKDSKLQYGFAIEPYELNYTKIYEFNQTCNGNPANFENIYNNIKDNMTLKPERDFMLHVKIDGSLDFVCGRKFIPSNTIVATIERHATTDGNLTGLTLSVW